MRGRWGGDGRRGTGGQSDVDDAARMQVSSAAAERRWTLLGATHEANPLGPAGARRQGARVCALEACPLVSPPEQHPVNPGREPFSPHRLRPALTSLPGRLFATAKGARGRGCAPPVATSCWTNLLRVKVAAKQRLVQPIQADALDHVDGVCRGAEGAHAYMTGLGGAGVGVWAQAPGEAQAARRRHVRAMGGRGWATLLLEPGGHSWQACGVVPVAVRGSTRQKSALTDHVAQGLAHLAAMRVAHQRVQEDLLEGHLACSGPGAGAAGLSARHGRPRRQPACIRRRQAGGTCKAPAHTVSATATPANKALCQRRPRPATCL